jgi:flagellar protein FliO/FliZ
MDPMDYAQFLFALIFVLGLIGLAAYLLRRFGPGGAVQARARRGGPPRLSLIDTLPLDPRRRLVLIRRDGKEHLLLLGAQSDTVVETDIDAPADGDFEHQAPSRVPDAVVRRFDAVVRRIGGARGDEPAAARKHAEGPT